MISYKTFRKAIDSHIIVVTILIASMCFISACDVSGETELANISGYSISQAELDFYSNQEKSAVRNYFSSQYQISLEKADWTKNYNGEVPEEVLKSKAFERCLETKALLILCREKGIEIPVDFADIEKARTRENDSRKKALQNDEIVYGLESFTIEEYMSRMLTNSRNDVKRVLSADQTSELYVTEKEIEDYFFENMSEWSSAGTTLEVTEIIIPFSEDASEIAGNIISYFERGESSEDIQNRYSSVIIIQNRKFTNSSYSLDIRACYDVRIAAEEMREGEIRLLENSEEISIVRMDKRTFDADFSYSKYKVRIRENLIQEKFEKYFDDYKKDLTIEILDSNLKDILIN